MHTCMGFIVLDGKMDDGWVNGWIWQDGWIGECVGYRWMDE